MKGRLLISAAVIALLPNVALGQINNPPVGIGGSGAGLPSPLVQWAGDSNASVNMIYNLNSTGSNPLTIVKTENNIANWIARLSSGRINFSLATGYGGIFGQVDKCIPDSPGAGYKSTDTFTFVNGAAGTLIVDNNGAITGCTFTSNGSGAATTQSATITSPTGYGAYIIGRIAGVGTLGIYGDGSAGLLARVADLGTTAASIIGIDVGTNDLVYGCANSITGTVTSGSPLVTALSSISGLVAGLQLTGTNITNGTYISAVTSQSTLTLSANATGSGSVTLNECGLAFGSATAPGTMVYNFTRIFGSAAAMGKTVLVSTIRPRSTWTGSNTQAQQQELARLRINQWIRNYIQQNALANPSAVKGLYLLDSSSIVTNPAPNDFPVSNMLQDGLHLAPTGAAIIGRMAWEILQTVTPAQSLSPIIPTGVWDFYDATYNPTGAVNELVNRFLITTQSNTSAINYSSISGTFSGTMLINCNDVPVGTTGTLSSTTITLSANATASTTQEACTANNISHALIGTGGTVTAPMTGTLPRGWTISRPSGNGTLTTSLSTATCTRQDNLPGCDIHLQLQGTAGGTSDFIRLIFAVAISGGYPITAGTTSLQLDADVTMMSQQNVTSLSCGILTDTMTTVDGAPSANHGVYPSANSMGGPYTMHFHTEPQVFPAADTNFKPQCTINFLNTNGTLESADLHFTNIKVSQTNAQ